MKGVILNYTWLETYSTYCITAFDRHTTRFFSLVYVAFDHSSIHFLLSHQGIEHCINRWHVPFMLRGELKN